MSSQPLVHTDWYNYERKVQRGGETGRGESQVDMEQYQQLLEQIHGSGLHSWGIASGLAVSVTKTSDGVPALQISPGIGLDANGKHISLADGGHAEINPSPRTQGSSGAFHELADVSPTGVTFPTKNNYSAGDYYLTIEWRETFDDALTNIYQLHHTPWLRLQSVSTFSDPSKVMGQQLILGRVTLDANGNVTNLTDEHRRMIGLPVGSIQIQKATATPAPNLGLDSEQTGSILSRVSGGIDITVPNATDEIHLERDGGGNLAKVSLGAEKIVARQGNGTTESVIIDTEAGSITASGGMTANGIISANRLYMRGGVGGCSISYNAYHNDANTGWVFPDPTHAAITIEMDDSGGNPLFQVYSTTTGNKTNWVERFGIDGNSGQITAGAQVSAGAFSTSGNIHAAGTITADSTVQGGSSDVKGFLGYNGNCGIAGIASLSPVNNAGYFQGQVNIQGPLYVEGNVQKSGGGFKIDHPLYPANKYLTHSFVESPDMKNIYDGVALLDEHGEAVVELPVWVEALNNEFRYQLTCIGGYAPVYIAEKVHDNRFKIEGGKPGMEVSWQLTGIRRDAWAIAHRLCVEEDKPPEEKGFYLHPELHGATKERHVLAVRHPELVALMNSPEQGKQEES